MALVAKDEVFEVWRILLSPAEMCCCGGRLCPRPSVFLQGSRSHDPLSKWTGVNSWRRRCSFERKHPPGEPGALAKAL